MPEDANSELLQQIAHSEARAAYKSYGDLDVAFSLEDLCSEAVLLALEGSVRYDPERNFPWDMYVRTCVRQGLVDSFRYTMRARYETDKANRMGRTAALGECLPNDQLHPIGRTESEMSRSERCVSQDRLDLMLAMCRLPRGEHLAIYASARYQGGLTELADVVGTTTARQSQLKSQGMDKLKAFFADDERRLALALSRG